MTLMFGVPSLKLYGMRSPPDPEKGEDQGSIRIVKQEDAHPALKHS